MLLVYMALMLTFRWKYPAGVVVSDLCCLLDFLEWLFSHLSFGVATTGDGGVAAVIFPDVAVNAVTSYMEVDGVGSWVPAHSILPWLLLQSPAPAWLLTSSKPSLWQWWWGWLFLVASGSWGRMRAIVLCLCSDVLCGLGSNVVIIAYEWEEPLYHGQLIGIILYTILDGTPLGLKLLKYFCTKALK